MQRDAVIAIARKDLSHVTANPQVWVPMAVVPAILAVIMPTGFALAATYASTKPLSPGDEAEILRFLARIDLPSLAGHPTLTHAMLDVGMNYLLAPLFLIVPLIVSSVVSAESFAGEKERGTLESLLYTPVDLPSLFAGKVLAAFAPAIAVSLGSLLLCAVAVNAAAWPMLHRPFFPSMNWLPLVLLVIPALSFATILVNVYVSARVATFQAAYQMGGMVVLPVVLLVAGQATGVLLLSTTVVTVTGVLLVCLDVLLLRALVRNMTRARLFETQVR